MASGIDHVVISVPDPDAAAAELTEQIGLAFTGGGRHAGLGTFNRIAFLRDFYLELIGVDDPAAAGRWPIGAAALRAVQGGGGFATWGLADPTIRSTVARLRANGSPIGAVTHGSRERSDGERVEWWTATPPMLGPDLPPFLIRHLDAGAERGADALAARRAFVHPMGGPVALQGVQLALPDPVELASRCLREVGLEFQAVGSGAVATAGRHAMRLVRGASPQVALTVTIGVAGRAGPARSESALGVEFITTSASGP